MKAKQAGALLLIVVMVLSMLAAFFTGGGDTGRNLLLKKDVKTVKDCLKLIPKSPVIVQFASLENIKGTPLESTLKKGMPPYEQYRATVTKAFIADYPDQSWIELHEVDYKEIRPNVTGTYEYQGFEVGLTPGGIGVVSETSPIIYGYPDRVEQTIDIMNNSAISQSAYSDYLPLIERIKFNASFALIRTSVPQVYDEYYLGLGYAGKENYNFNAVLHFNSSANSTELITFLQAREKTIQPRNFLEYKVDFDREYAMINATGSFNAVLSELNEFAR